MPHMDGEETFRELRRINPDVRVVLSTGYSEQDITPHFAGQGLAGFIEKPYGLRTLVQKMRQVIEAQLESDRA
jgi:DNA-binding NtrC family response regulator